jgi:hypothetical protein
VIPDPSKVFEGACADAEALSVVFSRLARAHAAGESYAEWVLAPDLDAMAYARDMCAVLKQCGIAADVFIRMGPGAAMQYVVRICARSWYQSTMAVDEVDAGG